MTNASTHCAARLALALVVAAGLGCSIAEQGAPPLSGPSSFGLTLEVSASPDRMAHDGMSASTVTATLTDASGLPVKDRSLQWSVTASNGTFIQPSSLTSITDTLGKSFVIVTAPAPPAVLPAAPVVLTVTARHSDPGTSNVGARRVTIQLVPPPGTLPADQNQNPVASFTVTPANPLVNQQIEVDASATRDEGLLCMDACSYTWDYGNGVTDGGRVEQFRYAIAGSYTIRLTVRDAKGGIATASQEILVTIPDEITPVATASPTNNRLAGTAVYFDASGSVVPAGVTVTDYQWVWGDGTITTIADVQTSHTFSAAGVYAVRLNIYDNFGRRVTTTVTVTVVEPDE